MEGAVEPNMQTNQNNPSLHQIWRPTVRTIFDCHEFGRITLRVCWTRVRTFLRDVRRWL